MLVKDTKLTPHLMKTRCDCGGELQCMWSQGWATYDEHDPTNVWHYICKECGREFDAHFPPSELDVLVLKDEDGKNVYQINSDTLDRVRDVWF